MNYKELVREAIKLLDIYEPDKQCVDTYVEDSAKDLMNRPSAERIFITDTVYGCVMHRKLLDIVINVFYDQKGNYFLKADRNQFVVVSYLAMFHLEDLGLEQFSTIIKSLDSSKMYKFLSFFFNVSNLTTWIRGEWCQLYDATYVEQKWIVPLLRWQAEIEGLLEYIEKKTTKGSQPKKFPKKSTQPQEFALTKPKPRLLPAPELIPQQEKSKPVPASTHRSPKEQWILEDIKQKNHLKAQKVLYEANVQQFRCANPEKSAKTKNIMFEIQHKRNTELKFDSVYSSGTPATQKTNTLPIRMNTRAILQEGALYNRQMEEEMNRLERLMQGAREPSAFLQWQKEMKEKDLQEELARLEGKISHKALLARQRVLELNQHKALPKKEETAQLMSRYAEKCLREEKDIKLIHQIRAIESVPHPSPKFIDDTQTGGHELLCDTSLAELRERSARLKEEEQRELEKRRQWILKEKQSKEQLLLEQLDIITACRTAARLATVQKKEEKKIRQKKLLEAVSTDEGVLALQKTLELNEQETQERKKTKKVKSKSNEQAAAQNVKSYSLQKQALEKHHWLQLEQALEKQIQREASKKV